ncbi:MAG: hydrogenase maturation protease [Candidatus Poribacteria bacterium]
MRPVIVIGYGNPNRQDDGVGHYVADKIDQLFSKQIDVLKCHQLGIELVETIKDYDIAIFVDAQSSGRPTNLEISTVEPAYHTSAFTHFMKPCSLIALTECLYKKKLKAFLVSINGYNFDFGTDLSPETQKWADIAVNEILKLVEQLTDIKPCFL